MAALEAEIQQCKQPKVSSSGPASEEFSRAQNDSIQQEQAVMREQLKRAQLLTYAALAVAAVALIAGFI
jgi:hypothetical protein